MMTTTFFTKSEFGIYDSRAVFSFITLGCPIKRQQEVGSALGIGTRGVLVVSTSPSPPLTLPLAPVIRGLGTVPDQTRPISLLPLIFSFAYSWLLIEEEDVGFESFQITDTF